MTFNARARSALILAAIPLLAATARGENLQEAWGLALSINQQLQGQQFETAAAERNLAAARQARLPTVRSYNVNAFLSTTPKVKFQGAGGTGTGTGTGAGASAGSALAGAGLNTSVLGRHQTDVPFSLTLASVPLYTGGRIRNNVASARSQQNYQRTEESRTVLDLRLTVAESYVGVLSARRALDVARSNVEQLGSFARDVTNRRGEGLATRNDELSAEVSLANARLSEIQARNALEIAWARYNRYLGRPATTFVPLDEISARPEELDLGQITRLAIKGRPELGPLNDAEAEQLTAIALQGRPELAGLAEQARSLGAQADATKAGLRPQVNLTGGFVFLGPETFVPQGIGTAAVVLDWTLVDPPTRRRAEALRLQECATLKRRADTAQDIALEVRTRWLQLQTDRQRIAVTRTAIAQAQENIKVVLDRYRQQLSTNTDVLDAETRRIQSLTNYYDAVYSEALSFFRLHRAVGDL